MINTDAIDAQVKTGAAQIDHLQAGERTIDELLS
jgi:hypothetical protein